MQPRIAILYYGHVRNNDELYKEHLEKIIDKNNCDLFIYTSRYKSSYYNLLPEVITKNELHERFGDRIKVLEMYENNLDDMIECKKWMKEKKDYFEKNKNNQKAEPHTRCLNWVYKQKKAFELMEKYETDNNIKYDLIVTFRPDLNIVENIDFSGINEGKFSIGDKLWEFHDFNVYGIIDFFIFGTKDIIKKYIQIYDKYYFYDKIDINAVADNPKECYHPVRQIISHFRSEKIKFCSINKTTPVKLTPANICHKPHTGNLKMAILLVGHFTEVCSVTCKIQLEKLIKPNDCDIFIYTSKKKKYRGSDMKFNNPENTVEDIMAFYDNYPNIRKIKFFEDYPDEVEECNVMIKNALLRYEKNKIHQDGTRRPNYSETLGQWHKLYRCNQLLKEYEKENGNKYNVVMKLRPDLNIQKNVTLGEIFGKFKDRDFDNINKTMFGWCDVVYLSSPENINWISQLMFEFYNYNTEQNNTRYDSCRWFYAHENQFLNHCYAFGLNYINKFNGTFIVNIERKLENLLEKEKTDEPKNGEIMNNEMVYKNI
jgi:hypothetical protein